jgi:hypothetical protein
MPTTGMGGFRIFRQLPEFASHYACPISGVVLRGSCFNAIVGSNAFILL